MALRIRSNRWRLAVSCAVLAFLCVVVGHGLRPASAQAAGSGPYCSGVWLQNHGSNCTDGFPRNNVYTLVGSGAQHSVCVFEAAGSVQCSAGANQAVYNSSMAGCGSGCGYPSIYNNGYDWNQVYGYVYWS